MNIGVEETSRHEMSLKTSRPSSRTTAPPSHEQKEFILENIISRSSPLAYSHFSNMEKRLIVFLITFAATFSPLSSFIFFPAINALSAALHVSIEKLNLTVTSYMIVAGIAPAIIGDLADVTGRRVVYLLTMGIYCVANVGLAIQSKWAVLFILRMLQSAGSAGLKPSIQI